MRKVSMSSSDTPVQYVPPKYNERSTRKREIQKMDFVQEFGQNLFLTKNREWEYRTKWNR